MSDEDDDDEEAEEDVDDQTFQVFVCNADEKPLRGRRVGVDYGLLYGMDKDTTDESGLVEFTIPNHRSGGGRPDSVKIFVDGDLEDEQDLSDGDSFTIVIDD